MTQVSASAPPRQSARFARFYAGAWTALAAIALAYMVALAVQPNLTGDTTANKPAPGGGTVARFATDLTGLKQSVGDIQKDVSALRTTVTASAAREKEVLERLTAVEERAKAPLVTEVSMPKTAAQRQAEARAQKQAAAAAAKAATRAPEAVVAAQTPVAPPAPAEDAAAGATNTGVARFTVLNAPLAPIAPAASPIATGSIVSPPAQGVPAPPPAATAAAFGPGTVKATAPASPVALELASGPSLDALRLNWSLLSEKHGASLKNLEARYTNAGEGQPYQLVAGPLATPEEASKVCAQLKAKKVACRVTGFGGNAL